MTRTRAVRDALLKFQAGATSKQLAPLVGVSNEATRHALRWLSERDLARYNWAVRRWFLTKSGRTEKIGWHTPRGENERRLYEMLRKRGPMTIAEIAEVSGMWKQNVNGYLRKLSRANPPLVRVDGTIPNHQNRQARLFEIAGPWHD